MVSALKDKIMKKKRNMNVMKEENKTVDKCVGIHASRWSGFCFEDYSAAEAEIIAYTVKMYALKFSTVFKKLALI